MIAGKQRTGLGDKSLRAALAQAALRQALPGQDESDLGREIAAASAEAAAAAAEALGGGPPARLASALRAAREACAEGGGGCDEAEAAKLSEEIKEAAGSAVRKRSSAEAKARAALKRLGTLRAQQRRAAVERVQETFQVRPCYPPLPPTPTPHPYPPPLPPRCAPATTPSSPTSAAAASSGWRRVWCSRACLSSRWLLLR